MKALIYKPAQNAMQTGTGFKDKWVLEYERTSAIAVESIMGWNSVSDVVRQFDLEFVSRFEAEDYANRNNIEYRLIEPKQRRVKPKSYQSNFQ